MKKLKVTWQDGSWNCDGQQPIATAVLARGTGVRAVGEDTLVFTEPGSGIITLVIPAQRLVSAVEEETDNG